MLQSVQEQLEPQLAERGLDPDGKRYLQTWISAAAAGLRADLRSGAKRIAETGERTVVTKHDDNGRIVETEKRPIFEIVEAYDNEQRRRALRMKSVRAVSSCLHHDV
ncbi:hypothetical protein ACRQ5Q_18455 [Bradyrhizobium sp. PMVTL-01]|uniref:hypothetical protein n=1 Tax=Bradyrhizobium sp. PMVTL-01 TaxID=3434999 RepID=UPI003F7105E8